VISVTLPLRTVSVMNFREHWRPRAKRAQGQRKVAAWHLGGAGVRRLEAYYGEPGALVTLTRIAPRALDGDNLQSALKAVRDGVADALGIDDRDPRVTWTYAQEKGKPKHYAVRIEIRERGNT
jgi:hypothetical protein